MMGADFRVVRLGKIDHSADAVVEACFGKKDIRFDELTEGEALRLLVMVAVLKFLRTVEQVVGMKIILDVLLERLRVERVSQIVEMVEDHVVEILNANQSVGEAVLKLFVEFVLGDEIKKNVVH